MSMHTATGFALLRDPRQNKGTAFSEGLLSPQQTIGDSATSWKRGAIP